MKINNNERMNTNALQFMNLQIQRHLGLSKITPCYCNA
jgi:hypothetical protein